MPITINVNGNQFQINDQNSITAAELQQIFGTNTAIDLNFMAGLLNGKVQQGDSYSLESLVRKAIDGVPDSEGLVQTMYTKASSIESQLTSLEPSVSAWQKVITDLGGRDGLTPEQQAQLKAAQANMTIYNALKGELSEAKISLTKALQNEQLNLKDDLKQQVMKFTGQTAATTTTTPAVKAMQAGNSGTGTSSGTSTSSADAGKAQTSGTSPYDSILNSAKASTDSSSGLTRGTTADDSVLSLYDIQSEQQKRQHMMTLFFYYARMAMSGDVGAMYQFMRFIGYVIAKDKALQNVWMGTKLIELQETSRKATEKLLNTEVGESATEQAEWQKELQKIKSEESIVATSQKLISQMMEEFTQVVETLTNVQKSLLDVNGKILSNLSVWR